MAALTTMWAAAAGQAVVEEAPSPAAGRRRFSGRLRGAALALAFWTTIGLGFSAAARVAIPDTSWTYAILAVLPQCCAWALMTQIVFAIDGRLLRRQTPGWRILNHLILAPLLLPILMSIDYAIRKALHAPWLPASIWESFAQQSVSSAAGYAIAVGVSMARSFRAEARRREDESSRLALRAAELERQLTEARLHALQSQLNPHFLFNALNTISAYTETDPRVSREMMACLGKLLRASLDHAGRAKLPIADELAFLEDYLTIERLRFEDRVTIHVRVDEGVRAALVPSFILQPLVENAIRHGAGVLRRKCHIQVSVSQSNDRLTIRVEDDGAGLPEGWRLEDHAGVGLSNIAHRLKALYGPEHGFVLSPLPQGGARAEIALPLHRDDAPAAARPHGEAK